MTSVQRGVLFCIYASKLLYVLTHLAIFYRVDDHKCGLEFVIRRRDSIPMKLKVSRQNIAFTSDRRRYISIEYISYRI